MSEIKRQQIIADEALMAPLILAENLEKLLGVIDKLINKGKDFSQSFSGAETINPIKDGIEELNAEQIELDKIQKQIATQVAKNNDKYREQQKALADLKQEMKDKNSISAQEAKLVTAQNSSLQKLDQALKKNREEYAKLTNEEARNSKAGKDLLKVIQQQDKDSKKLSGSLGQNQKETGSYTSAIQAALGPLGQFNIFNNQLTSGLGSSVSALKGAANASNILRIAMLAIPIFLLITAITSLIAYFKGTEAGAQKLRIVMAYLQGIFEAFMDVLEAVGEALTELSWDKVKKGAEDFGKAIKDFLISRFELLVKGVKGFGTAISLLFEGKFKKAAEAAGEAFLDVNRAVNPLVIQAELLVNAYDAVAGSVEEFAKKAQDNANKLVVLQKLENKLIQDRRKFLVEEANIQNKLSTAKEAAADASLTDQQRLQQLLLAQDALIELESKRLGLKTRELAIERERMKITGDDEDALQKIAELEREVIEIRNAKLDQQKKLTAQISALEKKIAEDERKRQEKVINDQLELVKKGAMKQITEKKHALDLEIQAIKQNVVDGVLTREQGEKAIFEAEKKFGAAAIEENIKQFETILEMSRKFTAEKLQILGLTDEERARITKEGADEEAKIEEELFKLKIALTDLYFSHLDEQQKSGLDKTREFLEKAAELYDMFGNSISDLFHTISENRIADIDREQARTDEAMKAELDAAGDNEAEKAAIEDKFDQRKRALERQKIAEQRRAAVFDKAVSAIQAGIATALAVTKALPNIPLAVAVGIAGGIEVAAILAKQIPQYFLGGEHPKTGPLIAGELGSELMIFPSGRMELTPEQATLYPNVPAGTQIIDHQKTMRALALSGLNVGGRLPRKGELGNDELKQIHGVLLTMSGKLDRQYQDIYDERGYRRYEKTKNSLIERLDKKYRF